MMTESLLRYDSAYNSPLCSFKMNNTVIKYRLQITIGLLAINYMRIIPSIQNLINRSASGWIAAIYMICVLFFGFNSTIRLNINSIELNILETQINWNLSNNRNPINL